MIVVVGRPADEAARSLVSRWSPHDAALLAPRDLSRPGWRHFTPAPGAVAPRADGQAVVAGRTVPLGADGQAVVAGRTVPLSEITGVVTLLESITSYELGHIVRDDRQYVAAELHAFLLAWLSTLPCPVLNRPTPRSLAGCGWRREQWLLIAARHGIPVETLTAPDADGDAAAPGDGTDTFTVTVVGEFVADAPDERVRGWVEGLAAAADTRTLTATFRAETPPRLVSAGVIPDARREDVAAAALDVLEREAA